MGAALAILLATWSAGALVTAISTWRDPVALEVGPNARTLLFASVLALLTAWLGALPAALAWTYMKPPGSSLYRIFCRDSITSR